MIRFFSIFLFLIFVNSVFSQGLFESSSTSSTKDDSKVSDLFSGYVRGSAFGFGDIYDYAYVFSEISLKTDVAQNNFILKSDLRFRGGLKFNEEFTKIEIKEAFAGYSVGKFDIRLGNQIVMWGRTDGFNPTNNINPYDYFFLSGNHDDQTMSNFMLRLRYRLTNRIDLDLIGIPFYKPSIYRYDLFTINEAASFQGNILPDKSFENSSFATRINFEYPVIGFSISYFNGYNPFYGFDRVNFDLGSDFNPTIVNAGRSHLKQTFGGDFEIPISSWIFRGEIAYNHTKDYEDNMYIPNPDLYYVAGLEKSLWGVHAILQYVGYYVFDYKELVAPNILDYDILSGLNAVGIYNFARDMVDYELTRFNRKTFIQEEEINHAVVLSLNKSFLYDILNAEFAAYYNISTKEQLLRPKITYKPIDNMEISSGGFFMSGPEESIYDTSSKVLNGVFLELKANF